MIPSLRLETFVSFAILGHIYLVLFCQLGLFQCVMDSLDESVVIAVGEHCTLKPQCQKSFGKLVHHFFSFCCLFCHGTVLKVSQMTNSTSWQSDSSLSCVSATMQTRWYIYVYKPIQIIHVQVGLDRKWRRLVSSLSCELSHLPSLSERESPQNLPELFWESHIYPSQRNIYFWFQGFSNYFPLISGAQLGSVLIILHPEYILPSGCNPIHNCFLSLPVGSAYTCRNLIEDWISYVFPESQHVGWLLLKQLFSYVTCSWRNDDFTSIASWW